MDKSTTCKAHNDKINQKRTINLLLKVPFNRKIKQFMISS